jgi:fructosamine-3-kinase
MWHKMIDDIVGVGHYNEAESNHLRHLLDKYLPLFDRPVTSRLLHMDIWHQNILVDDSGTVTGLVDWDRALWGDPEIEFAVLDYCGISQPAFWEGYGQPRDWSPEAQVRQLFYLLYELQKYIVIRHGRSHDPAAARQYKQQVWDIVQRI